MAKKINKEDIKELSTVELKQRVEEEKMRYTKMKFNHAVSPLEDHNVIKWARRDIARLQTEIRAREIEEQNNAE